MKVSEASMMNALLLVLLFGFSLALGYKALADPDIPWHLASGLWMLSHGDVPRVDFLAVGSAVWVAYSWLPELLMAGCFRLLGFPGLMLMQWLLVAVFVLAFYRFLCSFSARVPATAASFFICGIVCLFFLQLLAPFWHLRPQLLSMIFFLLLMHWHEAGKASFPKLLLLTVAWANVHVFWPVVPAVFFLYGVFDRLDARSGGDWGRFFLRTFVLCGCGCLSPYGAANVQVLWQYAFEHSEGYALIREFRPLGSDVAYILCLFAVSVLLTGFCFLRHRPRNLPRLIMWLLSLGAALSQRKYLPFFAVISAAECVEYLSSLSMAGFERQSRQVSRTGSRRFLPVVTAAALFAFFMLIFEDLDPHHTLTEREMDLLDITDGFLRSADASAEPVPVLNTFDDGGWLGLKFYQAAIRAVHPLNFRTVIDGRTLVMGGQRLDAYAAFERGDPETCSIVESWQARAAVLPRELPFVRDYLEHSGNRDFHFPCLTHWSSEGENDSYILMKYHQSR
jgi:hypothetical protein